MFSEDTAAQIATVADDLGIEPRRVARRCRGGERRPGLCHDRRSRGTAHPLRGPLFDRRLSPKNREIAQAAGLASPVAGKIANPASQAARWRLVAKAAAIDSKAAHESVSWGIGQVMGAHWSWLGYANVDTLVAEARAGVGGQIRLMARFIDKAGLLPAIRRRDWVAFARGYNGAAFARNDYDRKLAAAYKKHRSSPVAVRQGTPPSWGTASAPPAAGRKTRFFTAWLSFLLPGRG